VPITLAFQSLKPSMGLIGSAVAVGIAVGAVALIALWALQETYGRDLDYQET
jgi:type III secretory pathway component EscT